MKQPVRFRLGIVAVMIVAVMIVAGSMVAPAISSGADLPELEEAAMRAAVSRVAPSVVQIQTVGGLARVGQVSLGTGPATGLIVADDGYIISSAFNFARRPTAILVRLPDGSTPTAKIVARDHNRQLVLLKVETKDKLTLPEAVPDGGARVGAWAIAVGRTFDSAQPNISVGIISAVNRIWGKAVQTDAKISPSNYGGPLIDIRGRVFGVLTPMSMQSNQHVAGAGMYDSGIGFAVPLSDIQRILPKLIAGNDLNPGLMGISLASRDQFAAAPAIKAVQANSPARKAGLKAGDKITAVNGIPVANHAQLKHQVSPLYAGDKVRLAVTRKDKQLEFEFELIDKLEPYEHPFLGILPKRDTPAEPGVVVRHVYSGSGAAAADIKAGDQITKLGDTQIEKRDDMYDALLERLPGESVDVEIARGGETKKMVVTLGRLPTDVPAELPTARDPKQQPAENEELQTGTFEVKLPEFKNECIAYVPEDYDETAPYGLVVWLHAPGQFQREELIERWKPYCDAHDLILLAPQARDRTKWQSDEVEFVGRAMDEIRKSYNIDDVRSVIHGHRGGGAMAFLVINSEHGKVHGLAAVDAAIPANVRATPLEPTERAALYWAYATGEKFSPRIEAQIKQLRGMKYPVTERKLDEKGRYLNAAELAELVRWIDSLDRI